MKLIKLHKLYLMILVLVQLYNKIAQNIIYYLLNKKESNIYGRHLDAHIY